MWLLADVIVAISHYAFRTSEYPVILSLEVHCSLPQQKVMAGIMKREFGPQLVLPGEFSGQTKFPTLHQLRQRILLKGKRPTALDALLDDLKSVADNFDDEDDDALESVSVADDQYELRVLHEDKKKATELHRQAVVNTHKDLGDLLFFGGSNTKKLKQLEGFSGDLPMDVILSTGEKMLYDDFGSEERTKAVLLRNRFTLRY